MEEIPNSIEFSDSDSEDICLTQVVSKNQEESINNAAANFNLGLEELMNSSTDSVESGCDVHYVDSDEESNYGNNKVVSYEGERRETTGCDVNEPINILDDE